MNKKIDQLDRQFILFFRRHSISILRYASGLVFVWFGALKLVGQSPVAELIGNTYPFLPQREFMLALGMWEALIGLGLIFKISLRATLILLWLQMSGVFFAAVLAPQVFFVGRNPFLLTLEGEFLAKNLVLVAASLVVAGYEIGERNKKT